MVIELRTNSLFDNFDYEIISEIHLDLAGEFSPESEEFQQIAHELMKIEGGRRRWSVPSQSERARWDGAPKDREGSPSRQS